MSAPLTDNPFDCADCTPITAETRDGVPVVALRYCPAHKSAARANLAAARAANPEVDAVHRMVELAHERNTR